jgi:hypothetical protein
VTDIQRRPDLYTSNYNYIVPALSWLDIRYMNGVISFDDIFSTQSVVTLHEIDICVTNTIIYFGLKVRFATEPFGLLHPASISSCYRLNAHASAQESWISHTT